MAYNITNKDYITITDTKVMVDGKETTEYRGQRIWDIQFLPTMFKEIQDIVNQEYNIVPIEMHVLSSETRGRFVKSSDPSAKNGPNAWVRFMFANGLKAPWVFYGSYSPVSDCAFYCAGDCVNDVRVNSPFRASVFGSVADKIKQKATQTESPKVGQLIEMDFGNCIMQLKIVGIKEKAK